jgi:hypothetical protein
MIWWQQIIASAKLQHGHTSVSRLGSSHGDIPDLKKGKLTKRYWAVGKWWKCAPPNCWCFPTGHS